MTDVNLNAGKFGKNALIVQLLRQAEVIAPAQLDQILDELKKNPTASAEEVMSNSGFLTAQQMNSFRLAVELLQETDLGESDDASGTPLKCSFCGKDQAHTEVLIHAPGRLICNGCLDTFNGLVVDENYTGESNYQTRCSFCGQKQLVADKLIANADGSVHICNDCLSLCNQIVLEHRRNGTK